MPGGRFPRGSMFQTVAFAMRGEGRSGRATRLWRNCVRPARLPQGARGSLLMHLECGPVAARDRPSRTAKASILLRESARCQKPLGTGSLEQLRCSRALVGPRPCASLVPAPRVKGAQHAQSTPLAVPSDRSAVVVAAGLAEESLDPHRDVSPRETRGEAPTRVPTA